VEARRFDWLMKYPNWASTGNWVFSCLAAIAGQAQAFLKVKTFHRRDERF
jgi:hypothetical protein